MGGLHTHTNRERDKERKIEMERELWHLLQWLTWLPAVHPFVLINTFELVRH